MLRGRFLLGTLVWVLAVGLCLTKASADGMPGYGSVKDAQVKSWQGFYVGLSAGLATGDTQGVTPITSTDFNVNGGLAGVQIGYNWQRGNQVFGIEGAYSWASIRGNTACLVVFDCQREMDAIGTVVGRYGLAFGNTLLYGLGGVAWSDVNTRLSIVGTTIDSVDSHRVGWTAGFGVEQALSDRVSARVEYAHIDFGSDTQTLAGLPDKVDLKTDTIRLGVNVKLSN